MLRSVLQEGASNPNGVVLGLDHGDEPALINELLEQISQMSKLGYTHLGLEIFKTGNVGQHADVDEARGFEKYTSGNHGVEDKDVACVLRKAERVDVRNYCLSKKIDLDPRLLMGLQSLNLYLEKHPNEITKVNNDDKKNLDIYRKAIATNGGYRQLLNDMKKNHIIGIGIDDFARGGIQAEDGMIMEGNKYFSSAISSVKDKHPQAKMMIVCGAMHVVQYNPENGNPDLGMAKSFALKPFFYGAKAKEKVLQFPHKINIDEVNAIHATKPVSIATSNKSIFTHSIQDPISSKVKKAAPGIPPSSNKYRH